MRKTCQIPDGNGARSRFASYLLYEQTRPRESIDHLQALKVDLENLFDAAAVSIFRQRVESEKIHQRPTKIAIKRVACILESS